MSKLRLVLGICIAWMGGILTTLIAPELPGGSLIMASITVGVSFIGVAIALIVAGLFE